ncbi:MAG: CPBP family glutamic-type intramembrane protease [Pirellulaceae bacterium]|nr:CPBP family glutamic-type intramembrane protease [Pirellulaceae bacterium]
MTVEVAISLLGMLVLAGCAAGWAQASIKLATQRPLIAWSERRPVPWNALDLLVTIVIYLGSMLLTVDSLRRFGWLPAGGGDDNLSLAERQTLVAAQASLSLGILAVALPLIALRTGATLRDFGLSAKHMLGDLGLGIAAFTMLAPPVYALQGLLIHFWKPSQHPLIEMFKATPDPVFFGVLFVAAAVVAPLFEELIFRVLLQGSLERMFGWLFKTDAPPPRELAPGPAPPVIAAVSADLTNPFAASPIVGEAPSDSAAATTAAASTPLPPPRGPAAWLPIVISSLVFALLHYSHGPDWIPLTLLALGLGYLYQRTHRLLPSLVVHTLLNSLSLAGLWIQTYLQPPAG